jgi:hypothetical protein
LAHLVHLLDAPIRPHSKMKRTHNTNRDIAVVPIPAASSKPVAYAAIGI